MISSRASYCAEAGTLHGNPPRTCWVPRYLRRVARSLWRVKAVAGSHVDTIHGRLGCRLAGLSVVKFQSLAPPNGNLLKSLTSLRLRIRPDRESAAPYRGPPIDGFHHAFHASPASLAGRQQTEGSRCLGRAASIRPSRSVLRVSSHAETGPGNVSWSGGCTGSPDDFPGAI